MGAYDRPGRDRRRHGAGPRPQGQDRQGAHRRHRAAVQEEQDRLDQGKRPACRQRQRRDHRWAKTDADCAQGDHRRHRLDTAQRAGHRDRSQAHHHQRRGDQSQGDSEIDRHPRQWRGRCRVRVDLPALRQRSDRHRAAAADRSRRRRSGLGRAREVVQEAGHQGDDRDEGHRREGRRRRSGSRSADARWQEHEAERGVPARGDRPRAGHDRSRRRRSRPAAGSRLRAGWTRNSRPACPGFRRSAT